jgi:hypothetical protein
MKSKCPKCGHEFNPASLMGAKGGKATGETKARTSEQARAAVQARWAKYRAEKKKETK